MSQVARDNALHILVDVFNTSLGAEAQECPRGNAKTQSRKQPPCQNFCKDFRYFRQVIDASAHHQDIAICQEMSSSADGLPLAGVLCSH